MARAIRRGLSEIDPMFHIPEGVDELVYNENEFDLVLEVDEEGDDVYYFQYVDDSESDDTDYGQAPETPQVLGIIPPQVIRMGDTGAEVVDVIFEVEVYDAEDFEFRVTKA